MKKTTATIPPVLPPRAPAIDILDGLRMELEHVDREHHRALAAIEEAAHQLTTRLHEIIRTSHSPQGSHVYLSPPPIELLSLIRERCAAAEAMQNDRQRLRWLINQVKEARNLAVDRW